MAPSVLLAYVFCIASATARLATRGHGRAANAMFDASWHPKVKKKSEKGSALSTANVSFTKARIILLCFCLKADVESLVSAL